MLCKNPYMRGVMPCPCQQCLPCRVKRAALWANRLLLERSSAVAASFITLSYRDEELSDVAGTEWIASRPVVPNLVPKDVTDWLKRVRKKVDPHRLRYFLVGEYGDNTGRPHYHVALFGFPSCQNGRTNHLLKRCCSVCSLAQESWDKGSVDVGELNEKSAAYVSGYVTKKILKADIWARNSKKLRHPEFMRMSLKPGIGANAIWKLVTSGVQSRRKSKYLKESIDAPVVLRRNGSILPLGRYLRRKWREALGRSPDTPKSVLERYVQELHAEYKKNAAISFSEGAPRCFISPSDEYRKSVSQKIISLEKRVKIRQTIHTF